MDKMKLDPETVTTEQLLELKNCSNSVTRRWAEKQLQKYHHRDDLLGHS